jgi:hypothetical protein
MIRCSFGLEGLGDLAGDCQRLLVPVGIAMAG